MTRGAGTDANRSGRANRVAPDGTLHAVPDRGLYWGNRGQLLDASGRPARHSRGRNWLICRLEFHDRRRTQWQPGRLTELYFLDEATGLAAGHRPCGECRHRDYQRFARAWRTAHPGRPAMAADIDRALHVDRLAAPGVHRPHDADLAALPDGVIVSSDGFWLVHGDAMFPWGFAGYGTPLARTDFPAVVSVRTPRATVRTLRAGYAVEVHPSARPTDRP